MANSGIRLRASIIMAISVRVIRDSGNVIAPDIVDPLCVTTQVAVERGRVFIDSNYTNKIAVRVTGPFTNWLRPGSLADVIDDEFSSYSAQIMATSISINRNEDDFTADVNLIMERLDDQ